MASDSMWAETITELTDGEMSAQTLEANGPGFTERVEAANWVSQQFRQVLYRLPQGCALE